MAKAQRLTCFVVDLEDKPGALLKIMKELKSKNVSLSGLWGFSKGQGKGELYTVGKMADAVRDALKAAGASPSERAVFFVEGADRAGALLETLEPLAAQGINIEAMHAISVGDKFGSFVWVREGDVDKTATALG